MCTVFDVNSFCLGLQSSDTYVKIAQEAERERQSKRSKKAAKKRVSKSGKHRRHVEADEDERDEDIPTMHVVSTAVDAPEVRPLSVDFC